MGEITCLAKDCAYSVLDCTSGLVMHCEVVDKRETGLKSTNMERMRLYRSLMYLKDKCRVSELTTDASTTIIAFMGKLLKL